MISPQVGRRVKIAIAVGWVLSIIALVMVDNLSDRYRGGYEDMATDASYLFFAGGLLNVIAGVIALLGRRQDPTAIPTPWIFAACWHVVATALILGIFIAD